MTFKVGDMVIINTSGNKNHNKKAIITNNYNNAYGSRKAWYYKLLEEIDSPTEHAIYENCLQMATITNWRGELK